jgi:hypothetical protein
LIHKIGPRTSVLSGSPLQRNFLLTGSASLETSPILRQSARFMTPQLSHRKIGQGNIR